MNSEEDIWYVYRHIRLDTGKPFYIGIGKSLNYKRAFEKKGHNVFWKRIVKKVGYKVDILISNLSVEEANWNEIFFICLYGRVDLNTGSLCNLNGGGNGVNPSKGSREKNRIAHIGKKCPDHVKQIISEVQKGNKYNFGKKLTEEHKDKISSKLTGLKRTEENKLNMSKARKGVSFGYVTTKEARRKLSIANIGNKYRQGKIPWNKGVPFTEEQKLQVSIRNKGKVPPNKGKKMSDEQKIKLKAAWAKRRERSKFINGNGIS